MTTISAPPVAADPSTASLLDIEALLGYRPSASIALYLRRRRRPPAALRIDLPPGDSPDLEETARMLTGLVARVTGTISAELVLYGRDTDDRMSMSRYSALLAAIRSRLAAAGFGVTRGFFVVDGQWASADDAADAGADESGRTTHWHRLPRGVAAGDGVQETSARQPSDAHHGLFVPIAPASEQRRARAMAALGVLTHALPETREPGSAADRGGGDRGGGGGPAPEAPNEVDVVETLLRWNATLSSRPGSPLPSDARSVALLWSLQHRVVRDCVLMMCAWGFDAGVIALHEASDPEATEPDVATLGAPAVHDTFLGVGDRAPAPGALRSAIDLLRHLVSCAPESLAAPALTMLAWLEWARGRGLVADAYLEACRRVDPEYRLAQLLQVMIRNAFVPEWIGADSGPTLCRPR